jgi:uncharacterized membrane protein (UPF0127 family)
MLRDARSGLVVARTLEPAFDSHSRRRGLLGRSALPADHALIIAPCAVVHTFAMRFAIDIVVTSRDGTVLKVATGVGPRRVIGAWRGFSVIELAAGALAQSGIARGDRLEVG